MRENEREEKLGQGGSGEIGSQGWRKTGVEQEETARLGERSWGLSGQPASTDLRRCQVPPACVRRVLSWILSQMTYFMGVPQLHPSHTYGPDIGVNRLAAQHGTGIHWLHSFWPISEAETSQVTHSLSCALYFFILFSLVLLLNHLTPSS